MLHAFAGWRAARAKRAFTIVELLVATALLGLLSVILFSALNQVTSVISLAQGKSTTYQDVRTVMEQMARELQQAIPYDVPTYHYPTFIATNGLVYASGTNKDGHLHFIATIDNNKGQEEVEVHYVYDGSNTLYKSVIFANTANWDIDSATLNDWWRNTPNTMSYPPVSPYSPILEGVNALSFEVWTNTFGAPPYPPLCSNHGIYWGTNVPPAYVKVTLDIYDPQLVRRWGNAKGVPIAQTNLVRSFHNLICLPRGAE